MPKTDPCTESLTLYTSCVESKQKEIGGLRDGDECKLEADAYKSCRKAQRENVTQTTSATTTSATTVLR